jgi:hypothetical protein
MATATITVEKNPDAGKEDIYDFTPDERKIFARAAVVKKGAVSATVTEIDRDDPTKVALHLYIKRGKRGAGEERELSLTVSSQELLDIKEAISLAHDTALTQWMLEPSLNA